MRVARRARATGSLSCQQACPIASGNPHSHCSSMHRCCRCTDGCLHLKLSLPSEFLKPPALLQPSHALMQPNIGLPHHCCPTSHHHRPLQLHLPVLQVHLHAGVEPGGTMASAVPSTAHQRVHPPTHLSAPAQPCLSHS
jgi:hypothetical protein